MFPQLNPLVTQLRSSAIRDLLSVTADPAVLSLAGGLPAVAAFPGEELAEQSGRLLGQDPAAALQYGPTEGLAVLRRWVATYESGRCGRPVDPEQVIITSGSQQALDLVARTLVAPGSPVVVEQPGYLGALQALRAAGAALVPVPVDRSGLDVDHLADRLAAGLRPVAVYTVTTFQNPTGVTLVPERRRRLAELAERYRFTVIEDDPYAELRFGGAALPPVRTWSEEVVTLGSFSKTISPGLRVGWVVLPSRLLEPVTRLKQAADLHTGSLGQALVAGLLAQPEWWSRHGARVRAIYAERARALTGALASHFGEQLRFAVPEGGMFVWGRFEDGTSATELLEVAVGHQVVFVPGEEFFTGNPDRATIRLSFATHPPGELTRAVERLAQAHAVHRQP